MATTEERDIFANEYVQIYTNGSGNIVLLFQNEVEKTLAIGEQMNEINEEAYMNGYNWDAFFNYYLAENAPDILESMESDPEAGDRKLVLTQLILRTPQKTSKKQNALPTSSSL